MDPILPEAIEQYTQLHSSTENPLLAALAEITEARAEAPQMMVGHVEGAFLRTLVRLMNARRILEIGTFTGYSSLAMAEALADDGEIITCDINEASLSIARKFWSQSPHEKKIRSVVGPALETIKTLQGPFDLVFIDADKENYGNYWDACLPLVRRNGLIVVDNVLWSGRVLNPADATDKAIHAFNEKVSRDERVDAVMLTVRDGITLACKK